MKKTIPLTCFILFSTLLLSTSSYSAIFINESFESGFGTYTSETGGASVVSDATAPDGSHNLRFYFPAGFADGASPDIVYVNFSPKNEIWGRFYLKFSSGFYFHPMEQKLVFFWGDTFNFYFAIGPWRSNAMYAVWQGDGRYWSNYTGPSIGAGTWYKIDYHMKMNSSAGVADGVFQLWVNDVLSLNISNVPYKSGSDAGFRQTSFTPVFGGWDGLKVPQTQYIWFDGIEVSTTPLGQPPLSPPPSSSPLPSSPTNLSIN